MHLVFIHLGKAALPEYFWITLKQARSFYKGQIHLVIPERFTKDSRIQEFGCYAHPCESFLQCPRIAEFTSVSFLPHYGEFWDVTFRRMVVLEQFMRVTKFVDVVHIENDIPIYTDIARFEPIFESFKDKLMIMDLGPLHKSFAYVYVPVLKVLEDANSLLMSALSVGEGHLRKLLKCDLINEMVLLSVIAPRYPDIFDYFPILPVGLGSANIEKFGSLFDCASWGQFLGSGAGYGHHWIGRALIKQDYTIKMEEVDGRKIPIVYGKAGGSWKLNNLHVHNKNIAAFI